MGDMVQRWAPCGAAVTVSAVLVGCTPSDQVSQHTEVVEVEVKDPTAGFSTYSDEIVGYTLKIPHAVLNGRLEDPRDAAELGPTATKAPKRSSRRKRSSSNTPSVSTTVFEELDQGIVLRIVAEPVAVADGKKSETARNAVTKGWTVDGFTNVSMSGSDNSFTAEATRSAQSARNSVACQRAIKDQNKASSSPSGKKSAGTKSDAANSQPLKTGSATTSAPSATPSGSSTPHSIIGDTGQATPVGAEPAAGTPAMCLAQSRFAQRQRVGEYVYLVMGQWPLEADGHVADQMRATVSSFQANEPEEEPTSEIEGVDT